MQNRLYRASLEMNIETSKDRHRTANKDKYSTASKEKKHHTQAALMLYENEEYIDIEQLKERIMTSLENAPEGKLRCMVKSGKYPQYYIIGEKDRQTNTYTDKYRYLRKDELDMAMRLAQKEYDLMMLSAIKQKERLIKLLNGNTIKLSEIYSKLSAAKRTLISPYLKTDDEFVDEWEKQHAGGQNSYPILNGFETERGEKVRSKSEKMIADKLFLRGIPYVYEPQLYLSGLGIIYPDFMMLNVRTHEEFYLEHLGMMDDSEYRDRALEKISAYEKDEYYIGVKLLLSYETNNSGININKLNYIIDNYLI